MDRGSSPITELKLRDRAPLAGTPKGQLLIFNLRAVDFFTHPYFEDYEDMSRFTPVDLIFESLAFRVRPIAMTDGDACSIWRTLQTLSELEFSSEALVADFERRYRSWLNITDEELRPYWPTWERDEPLVVRQNEHLFGSTNPIQELWGRVYGDGPHADFKRVFRNKLDDWTEEGRATRTARFGKLVATIAAFKPLLVDVHNHVLTITTGDQVEFDQQPFTLWRG